MFLLSTVLALVLMFSTALAEEGPNGDPVSLLLWFIFSLLHNFFFLSLEQGNIRRLDGPN